MLLKDEPGFRVFGVCCRTIVPRFAIYYIRIQLMP